MNEPLVVKARRTRRRSPHTDWNLDHRASWRVDDGDDALARGITLLLEQQMVDRRGAASSNVVRYQLSDGGATLLATEDFKSGDRGHHNQWVFRRRQRKPLRTIGGVAVDRAKKPRSSGRYAYTRAVAVSLSARARAGRRS